MRHPDIPNTTSITTMSITATIRVMTPEQTAEAIKNVAKNIRENIIQDTNGSKRYQLEWCKRRCHRGGS
jgi:hypothetical protein